MPADYIIALLIAERDKLNRAIEALGGIVKRRRGRPPKNAFGDAVAALAPPPRRMGHTPAKEHHMRSAAARTAQATRMRDYWAKKRRANKK